MNARSIGGFAVVALAMVAACGRDDSGTRMASGKTSSRPPITSSRGAPTSMPPGKPMTTPFLPPIGGKYAASSKTAMSITGDLELTANAMNFSFDMRYGSRTSGHTRGEAHWTRDGDTYAALFGVQPDADIEIRGVFFETLGKGAKNGGVCGKERPTFAALTPLGVSPNGSDVAIAFFKGYIPPGLEAVSSALCGTYRYAPVGPR